jgi:hypothetical protein
VCGYLFGTKVFFITAVSILLFCCWRNDNDRSRNFVVDGMYAVMAIPTVVGSVLLSGKVMEEARRYFSTLD